MLSRALERFAACTHGDSLCLNCEKGLMRSGRLCEEHIPSVGKLFRAIADSASWNDKDELQQLSVAASACCVEDRH